MSAKPRVPNLGFLIICGSVWGLSEAALGAGLESCARFVSGSIMTGVALFFISAAWAKSRRAFGPAIVVGIALVFKLLDSVLLGLPIRHGAIANPMFAFVTEGLAFMILVPFVAEAWKRRAVGQAFLGGFSALAAVNLFPLVKFATGIPACVYPGTTTALSLYYAPIAVGVSLITVPLGIAAAARAEAFETSSALKLTGARQWLIPTAAASLCLLIQVLFRSI